MKKIVRKWRQKPGSGLKTGATSDIWTFEIGQNYETKPLGDNTLGMSESTTTVCIDYLFNKLLIRIILFLAIIFT